jgi:hypothetical protein
MTDSSEQSIDAESTPADPGAPAAPDLPPTAAGADSTVGTGSVIGIGCLFVVLLVICIGGAVYLVR